MCRTLFPGIYFCLKKHCLLNFVKHILLIHFCKRTFVRGGGKNRGLNSRQITHFPKNKDFYCKIVV
jgi:hypothetical protein